MKNRSVKLRSEKFSIILIDASLPTDELNEPLGIEVLAGELNRRFGDSIELRLLSCSFDEINSFDFECLIRSDLIGISSKIGSYEIISQILKKITSICFYYPKPLIILGGVLATFAYDTIIQEQKDVICILGEGEDALSNIVEIMLETKNNLIEQIKLQIIRRLIPNIAFRINQSTIETGRKVIDLSNRRPPRRDLLHNTINQSGIVRVEGSRGCPWGQCTFCCVKNKYGETRWRPFDLKKVVNEIIELSNAGAKMVYFTDEDFIGESHNRVIELATRIIHSKKSGEICKEMAFFVSTSVRSLLLKKRTKDEDVIKTLKLIHQAGFREIFLGIESGCDEQLERYKKGVTSLDNMKAITVLKELGFYVDIGFLMFDPEMTINDLKANIKFIEKAGLTAHDSRFIKRMRAIPKTQISNILVKKGLIKQKQLEINTLQFPVEFACPHISKIVEAFKRWEKHTLQIENIIQGCLRGQEAESINRTELRTFLGKLRFLDFEILRNLVAFEENKCLKNEKLVDGYLAVHLDIFKQLYMIFTGKHHFFDQRKLSTNSGKQLPTFDRRKKE